MFIQEKTFKKILCALGWGYAVFLLYFILFRNSGYAFDFRGYYEAADELFHSGLNPYTRGWFYACPPMTLNLYRPFLFLTLRQAELLMMLLKIAGFAWMFKLWSSYFTPLDARDPYTIWYFILAFNGALHYDIISGNVSGFLQMLLWCGFVALLQSRTVLFCALVILAGSIKPDLIGFLGLLLFIEKRPKWSAFFGSILVYVGVFALNHVFYGNLMKDFYGVMKKIGDYNRGVNNPSTLAFLRDYWASLRHKYPVPDHMEDGLYVLILAGVFSTSYRYFQRYRKSVAEIDKKIVILFMCVIFGILTPRIPPYLYALMLIPCFYMLRLYGSRLAVPLATVFIMFPRDDTSFPVLMVKTFHEFDVYLQLFGLYIVWYFFLLYLYDKTEEALGRGLAEGSR